MFELALIFLALVFIKHFLVDFVWQTEKMVREKGNLSEMGGYIHAISHTLGTIACGFILYLFGYMVKDFSYQTMINILWMVWVYSIVEGISHYVIDFIKMNYGKQAKLSANDKKFWIAIGADQLAHYLVYVVMTLAIFTDSSVTGTL